MLKLVLLKPEKTKMNDVRFQIVKTPERFKHRYTSELMIYDTQNDCYYSISASTQFALMNGIPVHSVYDGKNKSTQFRIE